MSARGAELAVVVGATGSLGGAIVASLLQRGLRVLAVARRAESLQALRTHHGESDLHACVADLSEDAAITTIAAAVRAQACPVRMVVHGPGVAVAGGVMTAPTSALVDAVNIKAGGMLRLVRAVDPCLVAGSRLVAIAGHYGLEPTAYAAAAGVGNAALINLMRQLSLAYGDRGVTAHTLTPGPVETERLRRVADDRARLEGSSVDAVLDQLRAESSLKQLTTADQIAWAVSLLLDPQADALTGGTLMLDSGRRRGLP